MRLVPVSCAAIVAMAAGQVASAQFIEGFEHGDWLGNYTALQGSGSETLSAAAARSGSFGASLSTGAWWKNSNPGAVIGDGENFSYHARMSTGGRAYIGFTSDDFASQAYTVVAASNTANLLIQQNNGFGFLDLAVSSPITWSPTEWYEIVVSYENGVITAEAFNSSGVSLAPAIEANTGHVTGGTMFIRGFGMQIDDMEFGGGASENALVLDWNTHEQIGAKSTAAAGLNPLVTTTPGDFVAALPTVSWRMVTIDNPSNGFSASDSDAIADYIAKGGRVHMSYWNLDADPTLQAAFGVAGATDFTTPRPVFARDAHASWGGLGSVGTSGLDPWADNGDTLTVGADCGAGAPIIVGDFDSAGSGEGAIVTTGQTLVNGFDYDSMDLAAVERLVTNQIRWLRSSDPTPQRGPTGCIADCDENGEVDFFDFLCFQNLFAAGDCEADCDRDGDLNFFDFLCFQNEFAAGCPDLTIREYGTEAPPSVDCGTTITPFPPDPAPLFTDVTSVASPHGGQLNFSIPVNHRRITQGWASWSHGYLGDVYFTNGQAVLDTTVPANSAFYLYIEPNPFAEIEFEVIGSAGGTDVSATDLIHGQSGAKGFGFCGGVENVRVRTTDGITDFAVGEFGIAD